MSRDRNNIENELAEQNRLLRVWQSVHHNYIDTGSEAKITAAAQLSEIHAAIAALTAELVALGQAPDADS